MTGYDFSSHCIKTREDITSSQKQKPAVTTKITVRHQGGNKRAYRIIDFKRNKDNVVGTIATIEYDPNCTPSPLRRRGQDLHLGTKRLESRPKN